MSATAQTSLPSVRKNGFPDARERVFVVGYLLAFVVIATASVSHGPQHCDANMDAEIPINILLGKGPVSFAHSQTPPGTRIADTAPVYGWAMTTWIRIFGISSPAIMSMNVVVIACTTFLLWCFLGRAKLLRHCWSRLGFVASLPLIGPVSVIYGINRYDSFGMLGLAVACLSLTVHNRPARLLAMIVAGLLIGTGGFHVIIAGGLLTLFALAALGPGYLKEFLAVNAGIAIGLSSVAVKSVIEGTFHTIVTVLSHNDVGKIRQVTWHLLAPLRGGHHTGLFDADLMPIAALVTATIASMPSLRSRDRLSTPALFGLAAAVFIPMTLSGFGRYSGTYVWLSAMPVFTCCFIMLDRATRLSPAFVMSALFLAATALAGFPPRAIMRAAEWDAQSRDPVEKWISEQIRPDDVVYSCFVGFYPLKRLPNSVTFGSAFVSMTEDQRSSVNVLVLDGHENGRCLGEPDVDEALAKFGGEWDLIAELKTPRGALRMKIPPKPKSDCTYHVMIYRRRPTAGR